jgi:Oligosaccharyltransferase subunit Ribophorin II
MRFALQVASAAVTVFALLTCHAAADPAIKLERAGMRLTYTVSQEKRTRASASVDGPAFSVGSVPSVIAHPDDTLVAQASCVDQSDAAVPAHPQQAFLRVVRVADGNDAVYVMRKKSIEMRAELSLRKEIRADREFWRVGDAYRVEIVVGDTRMVEGVTVVVVESLTFDGESTSVLNVFRAPTGNVFDFDVGVKKFLLPEFTSPVAPGEKQAPFVAVMVALAALAAPFPFVFVAWGQLGVFPLTLPESMCERTMVVGFESCLLGHIAALVMFWLRWNIVYTWKVLVLLMVPTLFFGHKVLSAGASIHVSRQGKSKKTE